MLRFRCAVILGTVCLSASLGSAFGDQSQPLLDSLSFSLTCQVVMWLMSTMDVDSSEEGVQATVNYGPREKFWNSMERQQELGQSIKQQC